MEEKQGQDFLKLARNGSTNDLCMWMLQNLTKQEFEHFAILTWAVWQEKHRIYHSTGKVEVVDNLDYADEFLSNFRIAHTTKQLNMNMEIMGDDILWQKPRVRYWRLDVDVCVNYDKSLFRIGGVIRNHQGNIVMTFDKQTTKPSLVIEGELMAIKEELQLAVKRKIQLLLIVSDSSLVVQAQSPRFLQI